MFLSPSSPSSLSCFIPLKGSTIAVFLAHGFLKAEGPNSEGVCFKDRQREREKVQEGKLRKLEGRGEAGKEEFNDHSTEERD